MASADQLDFQVSWSGVDSVDGKFATVNMDRDREVELSIVHPVFPLTTSSNPQTAGSVAGAGDYLSGTVVTLVATANLGWEFTIWSGACSGSGGCVVVMDSGETVIANFQATSGTGTPVPAVIVPTPTPPPQPSSTLFLHPRPLDTRVRSPRGRSTLRWSRSAESGSCCSSP